MKLISIITVNYNQPAVTEEMLESILQNNTYPAIEIIVVDNGSRENPVPAWKEKYPSIQFIRSEKNRGFAGGNNLGICCAKGDYLFFVNNDTVFTPGLVSLLANTLGQHASAGIVSPKILYYFEPQLLQYAGFTPMNYKTARNRCIGNKEEDNGQYDHLTGTTAYAHGAAMMVKREAVIMAGMMPENYFLYYEEMDWCERIKKAGYDVHVNMQALIYHKESVSTGKQSPLKEYYINRNRILFIKENTSRWNYAIFLFYFLYFVMPRNVVRYVVKGQYRLIPALMKAVWWNISKTTNALQTGFTFR